jgi:hypothetical protein
MPAYGHRWCSREFRQLGVESGEAWILYVIDDASGQTIPATIKLARNTRKLGDSHFRAPFGTRYFQRDRWPARFRNASQRHAKDFKFVTVGSHAL